MARSPAEWARMKESREYRQQRIAIGSKCHEIDSAIPNIQTIISELDRQLPSNVDPKLIAEFKRRKTRFDSVVGALQDHVYGQNEQPGEIQHYIRKILYFEDILKAAKDVRDQAEKIAKYSNAGLFRSLIHRLSQGINAAHNGLISVARTLLPFLKPQAPEPLSVDGPIKMDAILGTLERLSTLQTQVTKPIILPEAGQTPVSKQEQSQRPTLESSTLQKQRRI